MAGERWSVGFVATGGSAGSVYAQLLAGSTRSISVRSITVTSCGGVGNVTLTRAFDNGGAAGGPGCTATGTPHRSTVTGIDLAVLVRSWGSNPTGYTDKIRTSLLPVGTGQSKRIWRATDGPLVIEPGSSVLLINGGSGSDAAIGINMTWEEVPV